MRWLTNVYDFRFKLTATAAIGIHPTKTQIVTAGEFQLRHLKKKNTSSARIAYIFMLFYEPKIVLWKE